MTLLPALAAGAGITLALAPFDLKLLILLGPALLYLIQRHQTPRQAIVSGYCFGLGFWAQALPGSTSASTPMVTHRPCWRVC